MIVEDRGQLPVLSYNCIILTKETSLPAKLLLLVRKCFTRFQKARFDTSPVSVAFLKCCFIAFFLKATHLFLCLLNLSSFSFVGFLLYLFFSLCERVQSICLSFCTRCLGQERSFKKSTRVWAFFLSIPISLYKNEAKTSLLWWSSTKSTQNTRSTCYSLLQALSI